jgi:cell wall-associated NlpC family hydrolase
LWGGRSLHDEKISDVLTGVDCSGLINWSFRQTGRGVPRDAHEQYMKAQRLEANNVKPGDLFFLAKKDKPEKIVHVGFFTGGDNLLEAPESGKVVREITFRERFGKELKDLKNGDVVGDRIIYFGTLFTGGL